MNEKRYRAVLFDLGGTLRIALEDEPYMRHARRKMTELAGAPLQVEDFYQLVEDRYESYRRWALGENKEAGDRELWCRWLLPDYDQKRIAQVCHELSFEYRQSKGRRVVVDGGAEVIRTLHERGAEIYHIAARELGVDLADCVSVADNIKRDIPGAKAAGIGCNIIFRSPEKKHPVEFTEETRPDAVIDTFPELLELLPPLK